MAECSPTVVSPFDGSVPSCATINLNADHLDMMCAMTTRTLRCGLCESFSVIPDLPWDQQAAIVEQWLEEHRLNSHPEIDESDLTHEIDPL